MGRHATQLSQHVLIVRRQIQSASSLPEVVPVSSPPHIVDTLIAERAPTLTGWRPTRWAVRGMLDRALHYAEAVRLADAVAGLDGHGAMRLVRELLALTVEVSGIEHVPEHGRILIVPNHPTGLADGVALYQALVARRPDLRFFINRDALRVAPGFGDIFIPVEWLKSKRSHAGSRDVLRLTATAFRDEAALVLFPSGRLAHLTWQGVRERPWLPTAINLARRHDAPIVPLHIGACNSTLFYALSQLSSELRDITLFHELLNKRHRRFRLSFGPALDASALAPDPAIAIRELSDYVQNILPGGSRMRRLSGGRLARHVGSVIS